MGLFAAIVFDMLMGVFDHNYGSIHHGADSDSDASQTHNIGVDPLAFHDDKTDQHAHGQGKNAHKSAAKMEQKDNTDQRYDKTFLNEGSFQVVHGPKDKT